MKRRHSTIIYDAYSSQMEILVLARLQNIGYHPDLNKTLIVDDPITPIRSVDFAFKLAAPQGGTFIIGSQRYHCIQLDHTGTHKGGQLDKDELTDELLRAHGHIVTRLSYDNVSTAEAKRLVKEILICLNNHIPTCE